MLFAQGFAVREGTQPLVELSSLAVVCFLPLPFSLLAITPMATIQRNWGLHEKKEGSGVSGMMLNTDPFSDAAAVVFGAS